MRPTHHQQHVHWSSLSLSHIWLFLSYWARSSVPPSLPGAWAVPAQERLSDVVTSSVWPGWIRRPSPPCRRTEAGRRGCAWGWGGLQVQTWFILYYYYYSPLTSTMLMILFFWFGFYLTLYKSLLYYFYVYIELLESSIYLSIHPSINILNVFYFEIWWLFQKWRKYIKYFKMLYFCIGASLSIVCPLRLFWVRFELYLLTCLLVKWIVHSFNKIVVFMM